MGSKSGSPPVRAGEPHRHGGRQGVSRAGKPSVGIVWEKGSLCGGEGNKPAKSTIGMAGRELG